MSRNILASSSYPISYSPSKAMSATPSRTPVKAKRAPLGERADNHDQATPRQHLVKSVKTVIRPRLSSTKSNASPAKSHAYRSTPRAVQGNSNSPSSSTVSSPAGANVSRPGHTPHPRRSSVGLKFLGHDVSMLMDTSRPDFMVSDTDESEGNEPAGNMLVRRGVMGPGRLMTPANSQESQSNSQDHTLKQPSPRRLAMRLPTPPASQPETDIEEIISRALVRPRPAPTPPRRSATPSILLNGMASPTQDISPNPRRKKSPRVEESGPNRLQSPFEAAPVAETTASPRHPKDRVEIVLGRGPRKSTTPSATPKTSKPRKSRVATKTPSAHPLSQSTSSLLSRARAVPTTAPQPNRRKSTPSARKPSPPRTSAKIKLAKAPRLSVPGRGRGRKSVTPAELKAMIGLMPEPVEQGSPSDDPLLLVGDDEEYEKTPAVLPSTHAGKSTGSKTAARVIDFDAAIASGSKEVARDYEVPIHDSEPDYDAAQDFGFDSGGDSDDEGLGNGTFAHVARASSIATSMSLSRQDIDARESSPVRSMSDSPFLSRAVEEIEVQQASPITSPRAASPAEASLQRFAAPHERAHSPAQSVATSLPSPFNRAFESPRMDKSRTATPVFHSHGLPSPAPSSPLPGLESEAAAASPSRTARSRTGTPRATLITLDQEPAAATVPASPAYSDNFSTGMLLAPSSPLSARSRSRTVTPRPSVEQSTTHAHGTIEHDQEDEEEFQDSWNASPLLLPGTPSALGLFMPEEADGMSTPFSRVGVKPETPLDLGSPTRLASPTLSYTSPAHSVHALASTASQMSSPTRSLASQVASPSRSTVSQVASPAQSTDPLLVDTTVIISRSSPGSSPVCLPAEMDLPVVYTHSPRRSPGYLPAELDQEPGEEVEAEDKENQAPPVQSTTPIFSPPKLMSTPPMYAFTFSPRFASPLRLAHKNISPARVFQSPIPAVEDLDARFEDECPSGDVTLEGNSADWSLSDEGVSQDEESCLDKGHSLEQHNVIEEQEEQDQQESELIDSAIVEEMGTALGLDLHSKVGLSIRSEPEAEQDQEEVEGDLANEGENEQEDGGEDALADSTFDEAENLGISSAIRIKIIQSDDQSEKDEDQGEYEQDRGSEFEGQQEADDQEDEEEAEGEQSLITAPIVNENEEQSNDEGDSTDSEEAPSDNDAEEEHEDAQDQTEDGPASPAPVVPVKIVLKLINRGIVKIEPASPVKAASGAEVPLDVRSTTPAYDPPQSTIAFTAAAPSPAPVVSTLYPSLPATPVTASRSPLVSTTPLETPPVRQQSPVHHQNVAQGMDDSSLQAGPSARPRSRLSRQISASPEHEGEKSIRVRTPRGLDLELDDADADSSMRSVVEVSSLDPKAAARAAAILKLNHAYIEHGDISKLGESTTARRRPMHSARLDHLDASRRGDKSELLYEAELEIVSTRRSRSRSMSRFRGVSEALTELPLPGAWNGTPKRKRHSPLQIEAPKTTATWGVSQWKKLEKVFRAEREIWVTERTVKAMPGGFIGWARMSTFGPPAPTAAPWDPARVVNRFLSEQGIMEADQVGEWSRELITTRVEALEKHAEHRKSKGVEEERSPKKPRTETPVKAPPSTVRKLFAWAMPSASKAPIPLISTEKVESSQKQDKGKGKETKGGQTFKSRLEAIQDQPTMAQLSESVSIPRSIPLDHSITSMAPPHPSSPAWKTAGPSRLSTLAISSTNAYAGTNTSTTTRPTPRTLSAILAESSSSTISTSSPSRGGLHSSLSQRSAALDALFSGSNSTSKSAAIPIIKRSSSVKDMVKSFEDSGILVKSMGGGEKR